MSEHQSEHSPASIETPNAPSPEVHDSFTAALEAKIEIVNQIAEAERADLTEQAGQMESFQALQAAGYSQELIGAAVQRGVNYAKRMPRANKGGPDADRAIQQGIYIAAGFIENYTGKPLPEELKPDFLNVLSSVIRENIGGSRYDKQRGRMKHATDHV